MIIYYVQTLLKNSRYALVIFACLFVQSAFSQDYYRIAHSDFLNLRNACMTQKNNVVYKIQKQEAMSFNY